MHMNSFSRIVNLNRSWLILFCFAVINSSLYAQHYIALNIIGPQSVCPGSSYSYYTSSYIQLEWYADGGTIIGSSSGTSVTVLWPTGYGTLSAWGYDLVCDSGCPPGSLEPCMEIQSFNCVEYNYYTNPFFVSPSFSAPIYPAGPVSSCPESQILLSTNVIPNGGVSYQWKRNGGIIKGATSVYYTATISGNYSVATTMSGCTIESAISSVTINPQPPKPTLSATPYNQAPGAYTLTASNSTNYSWQRNGVAINGATSNTYRSTKPGSYTVSNTLNGCTNVSDPYVVTGTDKNYVVVNSVLADNITTEAQLDNLSVIGGTLAQQITYMDDVGRGVQQIATASSPLGRDIVKPVRLDALGRAEFSYLPFTPNQSTGVFVTNPVGTSPANYDTSPHYLFYNDSATDPTKKTPDDTKPFSQTVFEKSPLSRPIEQGSVGAAWQPIPGSNAGKTVKMNYGANTTNEVFSWTIIEHGNLTFSLERGYFANGTLSVTTSTSEEGVQGKEYKDLEGRTVMVKTQLDASNWLETHYVYDTRGNLRFILSPESIKLVYQQSLTSLSSTFLAKHAYQYAVDNLSRKIAEKTPENEWTYFVYDKHDKLVLSQDPNQRLTNEWTFSKYDVWGRPVLTGTTVIAGTVETIRQAVESHSVLFETIGGAVHGYTNNAYPNVSNPDAYLVVSYYDDYCFKAQMPSTLTIFNGASCSSIMAPGGTQGYGPMDFYGGGASGLPPYEFKRVQGLPTGGKVRVLGTSNWLWQVTYYDNNQREVQSIVQNQLGGYDRLSTEYDFSGQVLSTHVMHYKAITPQPQYVITEEYQYDHAGRLKRKFHQIGTDPAKKVRLFELEYNELGQVISKQLHNANAPVQQIDFRQNIRSWPASQLSEDFKLQFGFDNSLGFASMPRYNGDLTSVAWINNLRYTANVTNKQQGWSLNYDNFSRLTGSNYWERDEGAGSWGSAMTKLTESNITYDWNGNLRSLTRKDANNANLDNLTYNYGPAGQEGNRLLAITDTGQTDKGFKDGNTSGNDYAYDGYGNLVQDLNKGISSILYNRLNLTERITMSSGAYVKYVYDAAGSKLAEELYNTSGALVKRIDYVGPFVYENNVIQFIMHDEGRALPIDATNWEYQYTVRDHLGSSRMMISANPRFKEYKATMESENAVAEEQNFSNLPGSRFPYSLANSTPGGDEVSRLKSDMPVGPAISLQVMPGDAIYANAFCYHGGSGFGTTPLSNASMITAIAGAFGGISGAPGEAGQIFNAVNNAYPVYGPSASPANNHPAAYINYILFDLNMVPITGGYTRVGTAPGLVQLGTIIVERPGYMYLYVTNEGNAITPVYFDDFTVQVQESRFMGAYLTYPFGAEVESHTLERWRMPENRYRFQGKELQKELGIELYDFGSRLYDPFAGRWFAVDPQQQFASPYAAMGNNPMMMVDPDGEFAWFIPVIIGAVSGGISGYKIGQSQGLKGWELFGTTFLGAGIGAISGYGSGLISASTAPTTFGGHVASYALSGALSGGISGAATAGMTGGNVLEGAGLGALTGGITGAATGAVFGGIDLARRHAEGTRTLKRLGFKRNTRLTQADVDHILLYDQSINSQWVEGGGQNVLVASNSNLINGNSIDPTTNYILDSNGGLNRGLTIRGSRVTGTIDRFNSTVYIAPKQLEKAIRTYFTITHELDHARTLFQGHWFRWGAELSRLNPRQASYVNEYVGAVSETAAYRQSINMSHKFGGFNHFRFHDEYRKNLNILKSIMKGTYQP